MNPVFSRLFLVVFVAFVSCQGEDSSSSKQKRTLPSSSGTHSDLLVVVDDSPWFEGVGRAIAAHFAAPVLGLPQVESRFEISRIPHRAFKPLVQRSKSILLILILPDSSAVTYARDVWAAPQLVATVVAPSIEEAAALVKKTAPVLGDRFASHDRALLARRLKKSGYQELPASLVKMGISTFLLPQGFEQTLDKDSLACFRLDGKLTTQFILVHSVPLRSASTLYADIVPRRDSLLKKYFEGPAPKSYLGTEMLDPPVQSEVTIDGKRAIETRGLWRTFGDVGGGPFLHYTIVDKAHQRLLIFDGFIYGPGTKKRNALLEMESIFRTARLRF